MILPGIESPQDIQGLTHEQLDELAAEIRAFIVDTVTTTGGHLGSNLGAVELTLAVHRVFRSPRDAILWDTGHQAYVHKILTGRRFLFHQLKQAGGLSGYPNRAESEHDWIENSHASTALSYAHGLATAFELEGSAAGYGGDRRVVAILGDGSLTGGMAYEALNNLGHSGQRVVIILNDNGRSYAPTISHLSQSVTTLRLDPRYVHARDRIRSVLRQIPGFGHLAYTGVHGVSSALREIVAPHTFFEALGVRYAGPIDGHDIRLMEHAFANAVEWEGPIVVHVLTQKGRGYAPAEEDDVQRLHDVKAKRTASPGTDTAQLPDTVPPVADTATADSQPKSARDGQSTGLDRSSPSSSSPGPLEAPVAKKEATTDDVRPGTYTDAFTRALIRIAEKRPEVVAMTAAMPGPTGLLPFQARFPHRFFDVGIAEQHEMTAAAGMAMGGLRPVVAVYATFFCRAFDQANLDVGLHHLPVVVVFDRAGITGDDGPSHHGLLDMALVLSIPGMTVFAPSSVQEVEIMLQEAVNLPGPSSIRFPKTAPRFAAPGHVGKGLRARRVITGDGSVCLLGVGKMLEACEQAAELLEGQGMRATVYDVRVVSPCDQAMLAEALDHEVVITVEDGFRFGGAGMALIDALAELARVKHRSLPAIRVLGVPKTYVAQGKPHDILSALGLDGPGVARDAQQLSAALRNPDARLASRERSTSQSTPLGSPHLETTQAETAAAALGEESDQPHLG